MSRWLRLETTWSHSGWLAPLPAESRLAWVELLCYVKAHGLDGKVKAMPVAVAARNWGVQPESVSDLIAAATEGEDPALAVDPDEGTWILLNWQKYQGDTTAKDRMKRYREKQPVTPVTRNDRNVTATGTGTGTGRSIDRNVRGNDTKTPFPNLKQKPSTMIYNMAAERDVPHQQLIDVAGPEPWDNKAITRLKNHLQPLKKYTEAELDQRRRHRAQAREGPGNGAQNVGDIIKAALGGQGR